MYWWLLILGWMTACDLGALFFLLPRVEKAKRPLLVTAVLCLITLVAIVTYSLRDTINSAVGQLMTSTLG